MLRRRLRLPEGLEDQLPDQSELTESLTASLGRLMASWGYRRVEPPLIEHVATFMTAGCDDPWDDMARGADCVHEGACSASPRMYAFLDGEGRMLALRPDMTAGVARLVAQSMAPSTGRRLGDLPLRLRYEGVVLRREMRGSGRAHAIRQAGAELVGLPGLEADAEVIALAWESALAAGISDVRLVVGHVRLLAGAAATPNLRAALAQRDMVSIEGVLGPEQAELYVGGPYPPDEAPQVLGRLAAAAARASAGADSVDAPRDAASQLQALSALLADYGLPGPWVDPALQRDAGYYTGVVFDLLSPSVSGPVAGGGRYDELLRRFGYCAPATGFAMDLSAATPAGAAAPALAPRFSLTWADEAGRAQALALARRLRARGHLVETLFGPADIATALAAAERSSSARLLYVGSQGYSEIRVSGPHAADLQAPRHAGIH
jgi:ATP phosphoribosyltransferase regulatory subunit